MLDNPKPFDRQHLQELGEESLFRRESEAAVRYFKQAIATLPPFLESGLSLKQFREQQLQLIPSYLGLAKAWQQQGNSVETINCLLHAYQLDPNSSLIQQSFAAAARWVESCDYQSSLHRILIELMNSPVVNPQDLALLAWNLWKASSEASQLHARLANEHLLTQISPDPLLLLLLKNSLVPEPDFEALCLTLRRWLLTWKANGEPLDHLLPLLEAVALHFYYSGYVEQISVDEKRLLEEISKYFNPSAPADVALYAAYGQWQLETLRALKRQLPELVQELVTWPEEEEKWKAKLLSLGQIKDKVSKKVQTQYEEYPYPRWRKLTYQPREKLPQFFKQLFPFGHWEELPEKPSILIAGCGTGLHTLLTASRLFYRDLTAIDLSLSSLAYAKRKAEEACFANLTFIQMDLLDLQQLNQSFDLIESTGVLHHMQDPLEGLKVLTSCLNPGGLMQIGLYSKAGRQDLEEARQLLKWRGEPPSLDEMRQARQALLNLPEGHPAKLGTRSLDFYSASGLKDLLFHTHEKCFDLIEIQEMLKQAGLEWIGFEWIHPLAPRLYRERFPGDIKMDLINNWHLLEQEYPEIFMGMYLFWVRKWRP